jgi:hypothetical protein
LRKDFSKAFAELAIPFAHRLDQTQLSAGHERFLQSFYIDWTLGHAGATLHALPGFFQYFG